MELVPAQSRDGEKGSSESARVAAPTPPDVTHVSSDKVSVEEDETSDHGTAANIMSEVVPSSDGDESDGDESDGDEDETSDEEDHATVVTSNVTKPTTTLAAVPVHEPALEVKPSEAEDAESEDESSKGEDEDEPEDMSDVPVDKPMAVTSLKPKSPRESKESVDAESEDDSSKGKDHGPAANIVPEVVPWSDGDESNGDESGDEDETSDGEEHATAVTSNVTESTTMMADVPVHEPAIELGDVESEDESSKGDDEDEPEDRVAVPVDKPTVVTSLELKSPHKFEGESDDAESGDDSSKAVGPGVPKMAMLIAPPSKRKIVYKEESSKDDEVTVAIPAARRASTNKRREVAEGKRHVVQPSKSRIVKTTAKNKKRKVEGDGPDYIPWNNDSEVKLLQGVLDFAKMHSLKPSIASTSKAEEFNEFISNMFEGFLYDRLKVMKKLNKLKNKYTKNDPKPHELKAFELSNKIWTDKVATVKLEEEKKESALVSKETASQWFSENVTASAYESQPVSNKHEEIIGNTTKTDVKESWEELRKRQLKLHIELMEVKTQQAKLVLEAMDT